MIPVIPESVDRRELKRIVQAHGAVSTFETIYQIIAELAGSTTSNSTDDIIQRAIAVIEESDPHACDDDAHGPLLRELKGLLGEDVKEPPPGESLTIDPKKLMRLLIDWHEDEVTDRSEARNTARRLITRMKREAAAPAPPKVATKVDKTKAFIERVAKLTFEPSDDDVDTLNDLIEEARGLLPLKDKPTSTFPPAHDYWVVTLRRNGDDEDSLYIVRADDTVEAMTRAEMEFREESGMGPRNDDDDEDPNNLVYINWVVRCGDEPVVEKAAAV